MTQTLLVSDNHFNHVNIIKFCERPFKDVEHMNNEMVRRWNERVKQGNKVINLGDFSWNHASGFRVNGKVPPPSYWESRLNGDIVHIRGNHDERSGLKTRITSLVIEFAGDNYYLTHLPQRASFMHRVNMVGHVHNKWKFMRIKESGEFNEFGEPCHVCTEITPDTIGYTDLINMSVDVWDYYPRTPDEIIKKYNRWANSNKPVEGVLF